MDLNVSGYTSKELLEALGVNANYDKVTITELRECLDNKLEIISNVDEYSLGTSKNELTLFFQTAFFRIMSELELWNDKFISVKEQLLPPLEPTNPVVENSSVVAQHVNHHPVHTFTSNIAPGIINPLTRRSYKKLLNINTKFRDDYQTTTSTDFKINLPYSVNKVVSMKLLNYELPKTVYTIAKSLGSNYFRYCIGLVSSSSSSLPLWTTVVIPDGIYTRDSLVAAINSAINDSKIQFSINATTGKSIFSSSSGTIFTLNFNFIPELCPQLPSNINKNQITLGWLLGFRGDAIKTPKAEKNYKLNKNEWFVQDSSCCNNITSVSGKVRHPPYDVVPYNDNLTNIYTNLSTYTSEAIYSLQGTPYFLLLVDDYQKNHTDVMISPFKDQSFADNTVLAKIPTNTSIVDCVSGPERIYFGPVNITRLRIRLFDEYERLAEITNADYSLTLELELVYDL